MRIIGGDFKGRRFTPPAKNWPTRPTTDYAREGLFNILVNRIDFSSVKMLDLFGGTGSHCYEFLSRGCRDVTYVDKFRACVRFVQQMRKELEMEDALRILKMDVFRFIRATDEQFDYIFAGPPYPLPNIPDIPDLIFEKSLLTSSGLLVLEHNPAHDFSEHPQFRELRSYGTTLFSFFQP